MFRALVLALVCLAPVAAGALVPSAPVAVGVATQGSVATHHSGEVCADVLTPYVVELVVLAGAATDVLRLTARAAGPYDPSAVATPGAPAVIEYLSIDSCAHVTVEGLHVQAAAVYEVTAWAIDPFPAR